LKYDFHAAGEFVLVESVDDDFVVQVRQEPIGGRCTSVAVNTAVATRVDGRRLAFYAGEDPIRLDGVPIELLEDQALFPDGSLLWQSEQDYVVEWPTGDAMLIKV